MNHISTVIENALEDIVETVDLPEDGDLSPIQMASETLGRDLLQGCLQEMRDMPEVWQKLSEKRQAAVIERLTCRISGAVKTAVRILAAEKRPTIDGMLESVAVKDGIKATFKVSQHNPGRHDLIDSVNKVCLLVVASAADHLGGMDEVQPDPDQNPLDLNGGDGDFEDEVARAEAELSGRLDFEAQTGDRTYNGRTTKELGIDIANRKDKVDANYLQSRYALSSDDALAVIAELLVAGTVELDTIHHEDPMQTVYRVVKPGEADSALNLE